jgi:tetratricopeptide (TPR) repeat protein
LGENDPETATTCYNIGSVYYKQGEYDKALEKYLKCLKI